MLQEQPGLQVVGHVREGLKAVQKAEELQPDLILLDIGLPRLNGLDAARRIRCTGARGYLIKSDAARELLPAVQAVLVGKQFVSHRLGITV